MGIKSLNNLLKRFEHIHEEIHLSEYAYKKVAIDTSLFVYKYKFTQGEQWMNSFVNLVSRLRKNEIHCVFIFDSPAPDDKKIEQQKRRENIHIFQLFRISHFMMTIIINSIIMKLI